MEHTSLVHMAPEEWRKLSSWINQDLDVDMVNDFYWTSTHRDMKIVTLTSQQEEFLHRRKFEVIDREPRDYRNGPQECSDYPHINLYSRDKGRTLGMNILMYFSKKRFSDPDWHLGLKDPEEMPPELSLSLLEQLVALCSVAIDQQSYPKDKKIKIYVDDNYAPWMNVAKQLKEKYK